MVGKIERGEIEIVLSHIGFYDRDNAAELFIMTVEEKNVAGKTSYAELLTAVYITSFGQEGALLNIVTTGSY